MLYSPFRGGVLMFINIILIALFIIFLIILFFLIIPYKYSYQFVYDNGLSYIITIKTYPFVYVKTKKNNLIQKYIKICGYQKTLKNKKEKKQIDDVVDEQKEEKKFDFPLNIITKNNIIHIIIFVKDIINLIRPDSLNIKTIIGCQDPYHNGILIAYYYSFKNAYPKLPINLSINWKQKYFHSEGIISGYILPIQILLRLLTFIFSIRTLKVLWEVIKYQLPSLNLK